MTTWQLFIQGLGYLMLADGAGLLLSVAVLIWRDGRESREVKELERMLER